MYVYIGAADNSLPLPFFLSSFLPSLLPSPGTGFEFVSEVKGGVVPKEYIPAVQKGLAEMMSSGVLAGFPVVDVKAALTDGSYHDVDSSALAFEIAAKAAFREGIPKCSPRLLEPMMKVDVVMPLDNMGDVIGDLNSRRGSVGTLGDKPGGLKTVQAMVPLAEMFNYVSKLRGMTKGRARRADDRRTDARPSSLSADTIGFSFFLLSPLLTASYPPPPLFAFRSQLLHGAGALRGGACAHPDAGVRREEGGQGGGCERLRTAGGCRCGPGRLLRPPPSPSLLCCALRLVLARREAILCVHTGAVVLPPPRL